MNVLLMGRSLRGRFSGVVRYTDELARALARRDDVELSVMVTRAADGLDGIRARRIRAPFATPNEYARALWEQAVVPIQVVRLRPDVYHSPNYILPLAIRCPTVVTVHDLAFFDASVHRLRSHVYLSTLTTLSMSKATRVICVSNATRDALLERFPALTSRTRVVTEGVAGHFTRRDGRAVAAFRQKHDLTRPYVLFVGTIEPRKNLVRLVTAFADAVDDTQSRHELVIIGQRGWKDESVWRAIETSRVRDRIRVLDYVADHELPSAYSGADMFVYPSLAEGFGLPPLEAMACGTAVLTSNVTSLPEVVGDAAVTADPRDVRALACAISRLLVDARARAHFGQLGLQRAMQFSWENVAARTLNVYREAAG